MLTKTLKKDLLELARAHGLKVSARMTKLEIVAAYHAKARKPELLELARLLGHKVNTRHTKKELLNLCMPSAQTGAPAASSINMPQQKTQAVVVRGGFEATPKEQMPQEPEIELPWRYGENRLVLMAVNPNKVYGYWEITGEIETGGKRYKTGDYQLVLMLMAAAENAGAQVVQAVEIEPFGEYYFDRYLAGQTVWLELALKDRHGGAQIPVMASHKTQMPSDHISGDTEELYLTVLNYASEQPMLVFSGQDAAKGKEIDDVFKGDFDSFPRFGY